MGRCMVCDKLVAITPRARAHGPRQDWYPVPHDAAPADPEIGAPAEICGGDKRPIR